MKLLIILTLAATLLAGCATHMDSVEERTLIHATCVEVQGPYSTPASACYYTTPVEGYGNCTFMQTRKGITLVGCVE